MMKTENQRFTDLELIAADQRTVETYSWQKTQLARLDVRRAINRQPYWLSQTSIDSNQPKKIILNYYQLLFNLSRNDAELIHYLLSRKFQLFIRMQSGRLEEVRSSAEIAVKLPSMSIVAKGQMEDELSNDGQEVSDYFVLDHVMRVKLLDEFQPYLSLVTYPNNGYELTLTAERCQALTESKIKTLCLLASEGAFSSIAVPVEYPDCKYYFTWNNAFSPPQFEQLLQILKEGDAKKLFTPQFNGKLQELEVETKSSDVIINLSSYNALKRLKLVCHSKPQQLIGLESLIALEELSVNFEFNDQNNPDTVLDLSNLKKLSKISASKNGCSCNGNSCSCIDLKGLDQLEALTDLSLTLNRIKIHGELNSIDGTLLPELQHLNLNNTGFTVKNGAKLGKLESLTLTKNAPTEQLPSTLRKLILDEVKLPLEWDTLAQLEELQVNDNDQLTSLSVKKLPQLRVLKLVACHQLTALDIEGSSLLEKVILRDLPRVKSLDLSSLRQLQSLELNCVNIKSLESCKELTELNITRTNVKEIDLANHESLVSLEIHDCAEIEIIRSLGECKLEYLKLYGCKKLTITEQDMPGQIQSAEFERCAGQDFSKRMTIQYDRSPYSYEIKYATFSSTGSKAHFSSALPICFTGGSGGQGGGWSLYQTCTTPDTVMEIEQRFYPTKEGETLPTILQDREIVYDALRVSDDKQVDFHPMTGKSSSYQPKHDLKRSDSVFVGIKRTRSQERKYCLNGRSTKDDLISISNASSWEISYAGNSNQYFIKWIGDINQLPPCIHFVLRQNGPYFSDSIPINLFHPSEILHHLLPYQLKEVITDCFENNPSPFFISLNQAKSKKERVELIYQYCRHFKNEALSLPANAEKDKDFINAFNLILREGKGSSYHRSMAFMALCHYYNIPVRVANAQEHYYAEIAIAVRNRVEWVGLDLGESQLKIIEKPNPYRDMRMEKIPLDSKAPKQTKKGNKTASSAYDEIDIDFDDDAELSTRVDDLQQAMEDYLPYASTLAKARTYDLEEPYVPDDSWFYNPDYFLKPQITPEQKAINEWKKPFRQQNAWLRKCPDLDFFITNLLSQDRAVLLRVLQKDDAWRWDTLIREKVNPSYPVVYIDYAYELTNFMDLLQIKDSKQTLVDGPLKRLLNQKKGFIIINWSNFTANERGTFKCMMDKPPTLKNVLLPAEVKIIGILASNIEVNDVFVSRCNEIHFPSYLRRPRNGLYTARNWFKEQGEAPPKSIAVDLYNSTEWPQFSLETLRLNGDQITIEAGPLVRAVRKGKNLVLVNPPMHDASFKQLLHRLTTENALTYNGEIIPVHANFSLTLQKKAARSNTPTRVVFDNELSSKSGKKYHICAESFYQLFELQHIGKDEQIYSRDGLLATYQEGDQFVVESHLSPDQWQRLYDAIDELPVTNRVVFHFYVDPTLTVKKAATNANPTATAEVPPSTLETLVTATKQSAKSLCIHSKDPGFIAQTLQNALALPATNLFYLSNQNAWSNLIEQVDLIQNNNTIRAKQKDCAFWQQLKAGQTVVLCGNLPQSEYMAFKTLFCDTPYLYVNGERVEVKGKVIWISALEAKLSAKVRPDAVMHPSLGDYQQAYTSSNKPLSTEQLQRLESFLSVMEKEVAQFPFSYDKYRACADAIKDNASLESPLKPVLHYHYNKKDKKYAFLSVLSKVNFSQGTVSHVKEDKLKQLTDKIATEQDFRAVFWQLANCFSGAILREAFANTNLHLVPSQAVEQAFVRLLSPRFKVPTSLDIPEVDSSKAPVEFAVKQSHPNRLQKQLDQLRQASHQADRPVIYLLGETATGKSVSAKQVAKENGALFYGTEAIVAWLKSTPTATSQSTLLLENMNLTKPGQWEFINGIKKGVVQYAGESYPLQPGHKLMVTGDPLHNPGRHFHSVLWNIAYLIWFQSFQTDFVQQQIHKELAGTFKEAQAMSEAMVLAYDYLVKAKQCQPPVTLRDIKNACWRLKTMDPALSWQSNVAKALYDEVAFLFVTKESRLLYKQFLQKDIGVWLDYRPKQVPQDRELVITPEKYEVWGLIETTFALRAERIKAGTNKQGKLGTLLIGPSSVGKSTCWRKAAEQLGFTRDAKDTQRRFYQLSAGCGPDEIKLSKDLLIEAFHGGSVVIYDELNLNPEIEDFIVHLLDGETPNGEEANRPGFTVLSSGNPPRYAGCKLLSNTLTGFFHKIDVEDFSVKELIHIATTLKHPAPRALAKAYEAVRKESPASRLCARNFFTVMTQTLPSFAEIAAKKPAATKPAAPGDSAKSGLSGQSIFAGGASVFPPSTCEVHHEPSASSGYTKPKK